MDLIQKVIEVTEIISTSKAMKFKDEKGLTYTLNKTKKDGDPTVAFLTYQGLTADDDISGKMIDIKYEESPWEYQGKPVVSRYIKMIEMAKELPLQKSVSEIKEKQAVKTELNPKANGDITVDDRIKTAVCLKEANLNLTGQGVNIVDNPDMFGDAGMELSKQYDRILKFILEK